MNFLAAGIHFLSGGQSEEQASANLNAMNSLAGISKWVPESHPAARDPRFWTLQEPMRSIDKSTMSSDPTPLLASLFHGTIVFMCGPFQVSGCQQVQNISLLSLAFSSSLQPFSPAPRAGRGRCRSATGGRCRQARSRRGVAMSRMCRRRSRRSSRALRPTASPPSAGAPLLQLLPVDTVHRGIPAGLLVFQTGCMGCKRVGLLMHHAA